MIEKRPGNEERPGSYAESRAEQSKFEALVREEDDWQDAVDDIEKGVEPAPDDEAPPAAAGPS
jgi:hypothetical protein